jgi:threonine synthase
MSELAATGRLAFTAAEREKVAQNFFAQAVSNAETLETIRDFHGKTGYLLDPHTAVGVRAALDLGDGQTPTVCLATAHPAKFGEAVQLAIGQEPTRPASLAGIEDREKRCETIDADTTAIKNYLATHAL